MTKKPIKKTDKELYALINKKIELGEYVFLKHSKIRLKERNVLELDVLNILQGKKGYNRKRNKRKDSYAIELFGVLAEDWKYCIEGTDIDGNSIRIIISFSENLMPIITVIRI